MPFTPTPELEHKLLCDLSDEQRTVSDVAGSNGIPLVEFITWLASDRTQQRITEIERAFTARIRLTALGNLNFALRAAVDTISTQQKDHLAREPFSLAERRERRQLQESARCAGNFIYRLAKLPFPEGGEGGGGGKGDESLAQPPHTSVSDSPSQREGAGGWADLGTNSPGERAPRNGEADLTQSQNTAMPSARGESAQGDRVSSQPQHTTVALALTPRCPRLPSTAPT